jgi:uncharacterized protein YuzE
LREKLPDLVRDLQGELIRVGRGAVADQLGEVSLSRWEYDPEADVAYLFLGDVAEREKVYAAAAETISFYDELGVNVDLDGRGGLLGIEILGAGRIVSRLKNGTV